MPAVAASGQQGGGDELGPGDEIKVFKDEGEDEREQGGSETLQAELLEEKSSLITESEQVSKIKEMELCRKRLFRLNHSVCSASTTLSCPLVACSFDRDLSFSTYQVVYCENCFGFCPEKKRCRFPPIRDSDFFPSEVSDLPGRKRLSHGRRFNAGGAATVLQRWKEFRGVFAGCGRGGKITFSFQLTASRRHHSAGI